MGNSTDNQTKIAVARINAQAKIEVARINAKAKIDANDTSVNQKSAHGYIKEFNENLRAKELNENRLRIEMIKAQARIDAETIRQNSRKNSSDNSASILIGILIVLGFVCYVALPSIFR